MMRTLRRHRRDVIALAVMAALAVFTIGYILSHQQAFSPPSWWPWGEGERYEVEAEFSNASGLVPGQAQPVTVAGVQVGDVGEVNVEDGRAVVTLSLEQEHAPIHEDATVLLRPRTPLKDMFVALDPGTNAAPAVPEGGRVPISQTKPHVDFDEILGTLDADTRAYLRLLLAAGSEAFGGEENGDGTPDQRTVSDLQGALKRLEPIMHHTRDITAQLGERRRNLRNVVTSLKEVTGRVASVDTELAGFVETAARTFEATGSRDRELADALAELPSTLSRTDSTLVKTKRLGDELGPTLAELRPFARQLGPSLRAVQPLFEETTPVIREQLRPFSREVRPVVRRLRPAAADLADVMPSLDGSLGFFNRWFDATAYNPEGAEEGYLFWGSWLVHMANSLGNIQDAHGAALRSLPQLTCAQLDALYQVELGNPSLSPVIKLLDLPDREVLCESTIPEFE